MPSTKTINKYRAMPMKHLRSLANTKGSVGDVATAIHVSRKLQKENGTPHLATQPANPPIGFDDDAPIDADEILQLADDLSPEMAKALWLICDAVEAAGGQSNPAIDQMAAELAENATPDQARLIEGAKSGFPLVSDAIRLRAVNHGILNTADALEDDSDDDE